MGVPKRPTAVANRVALERCAPFYDIAEMWQFLFVKLNSKGPAGTHLPSNSRPIGGARRSFRGLREPPVPYRVKDLPQPG
jgi:hypothetical protein